MKRRVRCASVSLWANRLICLAGTVLIFFMPLGMRWYSHRRALDPPSQRAVLIAFYCCMVFVYLSQWAMERLLRNILAGSVFTGKNVRLIRRICFCSGAISIICLPAAFYYLPLLFVVVIMAFLCLVIAVVADVMNGAVEMRQENDLTI